MELAIIPYSQVKFRWVSAHYDVHLKGTCIYGGELCRFKTDIIYDDDFSNVNVKIFRLNFIEKIQWRIRQFLFEQCVGYHWSYINNKRGSSFYYRKPEWLYKILFKLYYKMKKSLNCCSNLCSEGKK